MALAGDADLRPAGQLYVGLQAAQTRETDVSVATSRYAAVNLQQRIQRGFATVRP